MIAMNVGVIVGGDLARSTRIVRHAQALTARGARVVLAGYVDTPIVIERVDVRPVPSFEWLRARGLLFFPVALVRQLALAFAWWRTLRRMRVDVLLVQNPPAFPLMLVAPRIPMVLDWHNTTATTLRLRAGESWIVRFVGRLEWRSARRASGHLCVSDALRRHLASNGIDAVTLYDAPVARDATTHARDDEVRIVVPSSWSDDDDFALLHEAARLWSGPRLRFILTGRGPRRDFVSFEPLERVIFEKHWYEPDEYADALASADLGLSLHRGGLDLPMKLVEMLGNGLPVCALDYGPVLRERYTEGKGIRFFADAAGLARCLNELLERDGKGLDALRASAHDAVPQTWDEEWSKQAEPLLTAIARRS